MRWLPLALLLAAWLALAAPGTVEAQDVLPTPEAQPLNAAALPIPPFVPGTVLVGVRAPETAAADVAGAAARLGDLAAAAVETIDLRGLDGGQGDGGVTGLRLRVAPGEEWATIERLQQNPAVAFAEPDWLVRSADEAPVGISAATVIETPFTVDDPLYTEQWYLQRINLSRAWSLAGGTVAADPELARIRVAVIDTGVDSAHPDLAGRLLPGQNYITPGTPPDDDNGHGTHIAGLIGAAVNNANGMAGAALQVEIDPRKVLGASGQGGVSGVAQAIKDAADDGASLINLSLELATDSPTLRSAINYAAFKGVLLVGAAGNCLPGISDCPVYFPAAYFPVLAVTATTYDDARAYYSPKGPELDLAAPGGVAALPIVSTWSESAASKCAGRLRVVNGGYYCPANGTSMAAGLVSGVAALVWSMDPDLTAQQVREILLSTAVSLDAPADKVGAGRADAAAAVRRGVTPQVQATQSRFVFSAPFGSTPQRQPLHLENPSLAPMSWVISSTGVVSWLGVSSPAVGTVKYGAPVHTQVVITPSLLLTGTHRGTLRLTGMRPDGGQTIQSLDVQVTITPAPAAPTRRVLLPTLSTAAPATFVWAQPDAAGRQIYALAGNTSIGITLPFTVTLEGESIDDATLYGAGLVALPATLGFASLPNRCLSNLLEPPAGIYGWWANLNPAAAGSQVSTFQPDPDRFVVEYRDVALAGSDPPARVSFQIGLHRGGQIDLSYASVPVTQGAPPKATVGVRSRDGRFYNQVACVTPMTEIGRLPHAYQTLTFGPEDLY
jgi:subtilisin family serine protease